MRTRSLAARLLEGAGPRTSRMLAGDDTMAALERCLEAALQVFLAQVLLLVGYGGLNRLLIVRLHRVFPSF